MASFKQSLKKLGKNTQAVALRTTDRNLRLAVTGLAGAGKTAFITGLVNQLLHSGIAETGSQLPLWRVARDSRLYGVKRDLQPDLTIPSFNYDAAIQSLVNEPQTWPVSTRNISELRLAIKYRPAKGLLSKLTDSATLYLDIVDYPGEWLLDLPMLKQSFQQWSVSQSTRKQVFQRSKHFEAFSEAINSIDLTCAADELKLQEITDLYQRVLQDCVSNHGFYYAQPGRLLLPGELEGTPVLALFPLLNIDESGFQSLEQSIPNSFYHTLKQRYYEYVNRVVKPFYQDYFAKFDRQIVLVDCFTPLNRGREQFDDMKSALHAVIESFHFGQSSLLKRLFSPKIDKLLFAASKVDHVTRDQQGNVLSLLTQLIQQSQQFAKFEGCEVETMAISAIKSTSHGMVKQDGKEIEVVRGTELVNRQAVTLFPGEVPKSLPSADFWDKQGFEFINFAPTNQRNSRSSADFEHIRLDHVLQFLLGDKLK
ncbi:YcjX family protein [Shewanella pneumatophori]|uniref:YcjX family protein n=1 Tax=Shewanella pneumatophori TaxID=314092 RepID=A0A9X1ZFU7_9GAMM|nr:YcjX family protein [Shewanella pneumatophori]MCL1139117.1 YcjX family protein [Shewanella pneumatophori]